VRPWTTSISFAGPAGPAGVHDRGGPLLEVPGTLAEEQGLVQAEGVDRADPVDISGQECFAVGDDRVVDSVPVTAQLLGDLVHRPAQLADLAGRPPCCPGRHRHPGRGDALIDMSPRPGRAQWLGAVQALLVPHQPGRPTEARQIDQLHGGPVLDPSTHPARRAPGPLGPGLDMHRH
jgi:hypothetical protein